MLSVDIAAVDFGRDFLIRSERGRDVIDTMLATFQRTRRHQCARLKTSVSTFTYIVSM